MSPKRILLFTASIITVLVLGCIFFPTDGFTVCGLTMRFPTIENMIGGSNKIIADAEQMMDKSAKELDLKVVTKEDSLVEAQKRDSIARKDTISAYKSMFAKSTAKIYFPNNDESILFDFFRQLEAARGSGNVIHILHYGDSQLEGDRISSVLRAELQSVFGGGGVGIVPPVQPIPSASVRQSVSPSIQRYMVDGNLSKKCGHNRYGILGQMATVNGSATFNFNIYNGGRSFSKVTLLVGNTSSNFSATLSSTAGGDERLAGQSSGLTVIRWNLNAPVNSCTLTLKDTAEVYGISLDGYSGVAVDNIPMRGSSGTYFTKISQSLLMQSMNAMNVKLIIMQFGTNSVPWIKSKAQINGFCQSIASQIRYLKAINPHAHILFIGPGDIATRSQGVLQSYPILDEFTKALQNTAIQNGAMYWNTYEAMGGRNSIIQWVNHSPAWAGKDYIHFTPAGAKHISDLLIKSLSKYYDYYKVVNRGQ